MIEKYTFKRLNKDVHPLSLSTDGNRVLVPGNVYHLENGRMTSSQTDNRESLENILGNEEIINPNLPVGNNKVIGAHEDIEGYSIIFFVYNDQGNHSIHRFYGKTDTFDLILQWSGLNFTGGPLRGVGLAGTYLFWTDGESAPRTIDIADTSLLVNVTQDNIGLYKQAPQAVATFTQVTDSSKLTNNITADNFQFTYRYWYKDGSYSTLAPWSKTLFAKQIPDKFDNTDNSVLVRAFSGEAALRPFISEIEFFYRKNQSENTYFFGRVENPTAESYELRFNNDSTGFQLEKALDKTNQPIPIKSDALAYFKDRLFVTNSVTGLDINDPEINITATLSKTNQTKTGSGHFKGNGIYSFGYKLTDGKGRSTLVKKVGELNFREYSAELINDGSLDQWRFKIETANREFARLQLSGTVPSWVKRAQPVMTKEKYYRQYIQTPGAVLSYQYNSADLPEGDSINAATTFLDKGGLVYRKEKERWSTIDIMIPQNLPFEITKGMFVKCLSEPLLDGTPQVTDNLGDRIRVAGVFSTQLNALEYENIAFGQIFEIFELSQDFEEDIFYEIGESVEVVNGLVSFDKVLEGDTTIMTTLSFPYNLSPLPSDQPQYRSEFSNVDGRIYPDAWAIESPTNTQVVTAKANNNVSDITTGPGFVVFKSGFSQITLDYQKESVSFGRAFVEQQRNGQDKQPNKISFSDTFIQDSFVNGLTNFDTSNTKSIPRELGPIVKLLPIGGNIMLAIHERETSSLSIGEGFLKVGDQDFILQKTEGVVGDDRNLLGGYGTIYPESAKAHQGRGFFFDIFRGAVVRYTNAGLFPVSAYGMKSYFEEKAKQLLPYKDDIEVVGGIDPFHNEYVITFPAVSEANIEAETWGFNYLENAWNSKYSYIPEAYGQLGNRFFTFKEGRLWEHYRGGVWNNFYGVQYDRKLVFFVNTEASRTKRLLNCHLLANELASGEDYKVVEVRTRNGQESYIKLKRIEEKEQTFYAEFLKDINTVVPDGRIALHDGRDVRDKYFEIEIKSNLTTKALLHEVAMVMELSEYSR